MEEGSVINMLQKIYGEFSPMEKKAANYILRYPDLVVEYTVKDLAKASDVSEATVVRMCKHAGYKGYWALRTMLARNMGTIKKEKKGSVDNDDVIREFFQVYAEMMQTLGSKISIHAMRKSAKILDTCKQVYIIAGGDTGTVAKHLSFRLGRVGIRAIYNELADYYLNTINLADRDDALIAISKSGITKTVLQGVELAKKKGLPVIAITEYENSAIGELADYVLLCKGDFGRFDYYKNYSNLSATAVVEALIGLLENRDKIIEKEMDTIELMLSEAKL